MLIKKSPSSPRRREGGGGDRRQRSTHTHPSGPHLPSLSSGLERFLLPEGGGYAGGTSSFIHEKRQEPPHPHAHNTQQSPVLEQNKLVLIEPLPLPDDDAGGVPAINGVAKPLSYLRGESGWGDFLLLPPPAPHAHVSMYCLLGRSKILNQVNTS